MVSAGVAPVTVFTTTRFIPDREVSPMFASAMRKALLCSAISACFIGTSAMAEGQIVSETGGLPGYDVVKAPASIAKLPRVKQKLVSPPFVPEHTLTPPPALALIITG